MVFITGGAHQGKLDYARNNYKISDSDIADCAYTDVDKAYEKRCITNLQLMARNEKIWSDRAIEDFVAELISREKDTGVEYILVMDEVGSGIVPIKKEDRDYREAAGRLGCVIAGYANAVIRVTCGIGQKIK